MDKIFREIMRMTARMDTEHWLLVGLGVLVLGFFCLRGFGSRSGY